MSQRAIVGLHPGADVTAVKRVLREAGAEQVADPSPSLPDVVIATLPDAADLDKFVQAAKRIEGVRYCEPDAFRMT